VLCQAEGINFAFAIAKLKNKKATVHEIITKIDEFVIDKSKDPKVIGMILVIVNCSKGEKNIKKRLLKKRVESLLLDLNQCHLITKQIL
tara:strand:- start:366 stop:632 length:267 start_codon:yes stop_codon:yes gene_type:complete